MKRSAFVFALLVCGLAIGCSSSPKKQDAPANTTTPAASTTSTPPAASSNSDSGSMGKGKKAPGKMVAATDGSVVNCSSGDDKRSIELRAKDSGCEVLYTKAGESKSVANEASGSDYCKKTVEKIQTNLTNAGFSCQ